jgi:hypothetical protein
LFSRPRIIAVRHAHAPVALRGGLTPIRVVARGVGRLRIGDSVRFIGGFVDDVFFAPVSTVIEVRFDGLWSRATRRLQIERPLAHAPARVVVDLPVLTTPRLVRTPLVATPALPRLRSRRPRRLLLPTEMP